MMRHEGCVGAWRYGGEVERVARGAVRAEGVVAQLSFQVEAGAFGDPRARTVQRVAPDLNPLRPQGFEGEGRYAADRLGGVAPSREAGASPVADLELRHPPVDAVKPAAPDERLDPLKVKMHPELGPLQEAHPGQARSPRSPRPSRAP